MTTVRLADFEPVARERAGARGLRLRRRWRLGRDHPRRERGRLAAAPAAAAGPRRRQRGRPLDHAARPPGRRCPSPSPRWPPTASPTRTPRSRPPGPPPPPGCRSRSRRCRRGSIEEVAAAAPDGTRWFQLYTQADPARTRSLVERAAAAGYGAIVLTVDLPLLGYRERDRRSGFDLPEPHGNFADSRPRTRPASMRAASASWRTSSLTGCRGPTWRRSASWSPLPLVLKGILTAEDAWLALEHGVDGIVVSNHGARQLDRVAAPIDVLEEVVAAVGGRTEVWVDGGVRRGLDIAIAVALGARGVLVGQPILWALAAAGQAGVERALAILREEFEIALALLGAPTPAALEPAHVARERPPTAT